MGATVASTPKSVTGPPLGPEAGAIYSLSPPLLDRLRTPGCVGAQCSPWPQATGHRPQTAANFPAQP